MTNFTYETAIVAASGRGIGKETAMLLSNMGLNVVVIVITPVTTNIVGFNEKNICFIIIHSSQHRLCISSPFFGRWKCLENLYMSKNIVVVHGGKMWAETNETNADGKGATFYISLPFSR